MKKQLILSVIFSMIVFFSYGQTLKTYKGKYEKSKGVVEYQYFENKNYERVFQGHFLYKEEKYISKKRNYDGIIIKGNYKNNLKDGLWTYKKIVNHKVKFKNPQDVLLYSMDYINYYGTEPNYDKFPVDYLPNPINETILIKGNYVSGAKNGIWTIEGKNNGEITYNCKMMFNMDTLTGKYIYKTPTVSETGQFDNHGFKIGTWKYKTEETEIINKYKDGYLYWQLKRNNMSGEIISKFDYSDKIDSLSRGLPVLIDKVKYVLKISNKCDDNIEWYKYSNIVYDLLKIFPKGSNPNKDLTRCKILIDYSLTPQGKVDIEYNNTIKEANSLFKQQNYSTAIESYEKALKLKSNEEFPQKQIQKCNQLIYESYINSADNYYNENECDNAILKYKSASQIFPDKEYPIKQIEICKELKGKLSLINSNHTKLKELYSSSKKTYLIEAYLTIYKNTDLQKEKGNELDILIRFQEKMFELINQNTKTIKKRLKKEGNSKDTILDIFEIKE